MREYLNYIVPFITRIENENSVSGVFIMTLDVAYPIDLSPKNTWLSDFVNDRNMLDFSNKDLGEWREWSFKFVFPSEMDVEKYYEVVIKTMKTRRNIPTSYL